MSTQDTIDDVNKMLGKMHDQHTYNIESIQKRVRDLTINNPNMLTVEQITEIVNAVKQAWQSEFHSYQNTVNACIAKIEKAVTDTAARMQYDIKQMLVTQMAQKDKIYYLQQRLENPGAESNQHDALGEHNADKILNNPVMDRQEFPEGAMDIKTPEVKEWEIIEFRATKENLLHVKLYSNGKYDNTGIEGDYGVIALDYMLFGERSVADGSYSIHSVCRLSDNEVLTVGDNTIDGPIKAFDMNGSVMMIQYTSQIWGKLSDVRKQYCFTTADGVEVLDGYNIWFMHPKSWPTPSVCKAVKGLNWNNHYSTKEAAQDAYNNWLWSQPVLSLIDLDFKGLKGEYREELKAIIKERVNQRP